MVKKFKEFRLFVIKAKDSKTALKKARKDSVGFGDVVSKVRKAKDKKNTFVAFGGKRQRVSTRKIQKPRPSRSRSRRR